MSFRGNEEHILPKRHMDRAKNVGTICLLEAREERVSRKRHMVRAKNVATICHLAVEEEKAARKRHMVKAKNGGPICLLAPQQLSVCWIGAKNHPHVKRVVVSRRAKPLLLATRRTREREFWQLRSLYCKFISCFSWDRLRESGVGPLIYLRRAGA